MAERFSTLAGVLLTGALVMSGCSILPGGGETSPASGAAKPLPSTDWKAAKPANVSQGGSLRLAVGALPTNFNPQHTDGAATDAATILAPTSGSAVRIISGGGWKVDPDYAESVKVADKSPLTIEVHLNPRAVWQGGTPITSKDMVAFWKAQNGSRDAYQVSSTAGWEDISDVSTTDDPYEYSVVFDKPTAEWPQYIYPRLPANVSASAKAFNAGFTKKAISSNGPFAVTSIDPATGTVTEKVNPRWWGKKPKLDSIVWRIATTDVQAKAFAVDELDVIGVDASTFASVSKDGVIQQAAGTEWSQVTLNGARGPLKSANVRRGVAHAINRDKIADSVSRPFDIDGVTLGSVVRVPGQRGYSDSSAAIAYDPAEAKRLLAKAGYVADSAGVLARKGQALKLTMPVPADTPANSARATAIKRDLKKVGIDVQLAPVPAADFFPKRVIALDFDLVTFAWKGSAFPIVATKSRFYPIDSSQNFTGLANGKVGDDFDQASATLDDALRFTRVAKLDRRVFDQAPMVPIGVTPIVMAVRKGVVNYGAAQFEQPDWTVVGFIKEK